MSAGWVAASVRARAMTRRRLGRDAARSLAASPSLDAALKRLGQTPYGVAVRDGQTLAEVQHAAVDAMLWNVRVLAGWAPLGGVTTLRVLVGALEAANVEDHLRRLAGAQPPRPYRLGALGTAWSRLARTETGEEVRRVLAASPWGDPGGLTLREIGLAMRTSLAERVMAGAPAAGIWAVAATALLVAREVMLEGRDLPLQARSAASRVIGAAATSARTLPELNAALPPSARWALANVAQPTGLWRAEARWWTQVEHDGFGLVIGGVAGEDVLVGAVALMAVDAWRVRAALEVAAHGRSALEVFNAMA